MDIRKYYQLSSSAITAKKVKLDEEIIENSGKEPLKSVEIEIPKSDHANDISVIGQPLKQIKLKEYPKQINGRSFRTEWYEKFNWLEYSAQKDAAYCYPCRQFQPFLSKEKCFTESGFRNWKNALDSKNGFPKHENAASHLTSVKMWMEKNERENKQKTICSLVAGNVLHKHRYYVKSIAEVIQFLAVNELAFRGTYVIEEHAERGLFINLFNYTLKKDPELFESAKHVPKNANYKSPEIQNDIIGILAEMVRESLVNEIQKSDVPFFTMMEDGTRDKNNRENISIAIRFVRNGKVYESLLGIYTTKFQDAKTLADLTLNVLKENDLDTNKLLSQCYDGANVMSGKKGGVAAILRNRISRNIPYVHCYNHRLHLVLVKVISEIVSVRKFFDQCESLHNFFHHGKVHSIYEGKTIVRLLEQRWSGHLAIVNIITSNFQQIIRTLEEIIVSANFSGDDTVTSVGLKTVMLSIDFRFNLNAMKKILNLIQPADAILQSHSSGLKEALDIIRVVKQAIFSLRTDQAFDELLVEANKLIDWYAPSTSNESKKRERKTPGRLQNFIVMEKLPAYSENGTEKDISKIKTLFFEIIDLILDQFEQRFSDNENLLLAIDSLEEFDPDKLSTLSEFGISIPSKEELTVVKAYFADKPNVDKFQELYKLRQAFKKTYELFATIATFGCSTATCESSFSALTNINSPKRMSMSHQRMADLVYLAFEKDRTQNVDMDKFLQKFNNRRERKLQLY